MTAPWPAIPWTPPAPTEREQRVAAEANRLYATGQYQCLLDAVIAAEKAVAV